MSTTLSTSMQVRPTNNNGASNSDQRRKFTRGEKCLFTHLIITFSIILLCAIIFFIHLILVTHTKEDILKFTRRKCDDKRKQYQELTLCYLLVSMRFNKAIERIDVPLGYVYLKSRPVTSTCNALLLRSRWSVSPGHCTAMRTDPDMAHLLNSWRIKYRTPSMDYIESEIKRSVPHPHFDKDDFNNNIGVFEHVDTIDVTQFVFPKSFALNDATLLHNTEKFELVGWEQDTSDNEGGSHLLRNYPVSGVELDKCHRFISPIVDLRTYEFCVILKNNYDVYLEHGAVLLMDSKIVGFFSWGDRGGKGVPFIVVNILHFKDWLENIVSVSNIYF